METKFTEQQSLAVISEMIERARHNVQKGSANSMIFWGYAVAITAVLNFILWHILANSNQSYWAWALMIPCWLIDYFLSRKIDRSSIVKTQIDTIITGAWRAFGVAVIAFVILIYWIAFEWKQPILFLFITPGIMLMVSMAQYVTATATHYKPFKYGAFIMWIGAVLSIVVPFFFKKGADQFLILAIAMILSFVIPGHSLNRKANHV
jgi:hypothetical protein